MTDEQNAGPRGDMHDNHEHDEQGNCKTCAKIWNFISALELQCNINAQLNGIHPYDAMLALAYVQWNIALNTCKPGSDLEALIADVAKHGKELYLSQMAEQRKAQDTAAREAGSDAPAGLRTN